MFGNIYKFVFAKFPKEIDEHFSTALLNSFTKHFSGKLLSHVCGIYIAIWKELNSDNQINSQIFGYTISKEMLKSIWKKKNSFDMNVDHIMFRKNISAGTGNTDDRMALGTTDSGDPDHPSIWQIGIEERSGMSNDMTSEFDKLS